MLSLIEKSLIHLYGQLAFVFSTKGRCSSFNCLGNRFEHKSDPVDEFYKLVKF